MILRSPYPNNDSKMDIIISSTIVGLFFYLFIIIYQPFGTSQFEHTYKYLLLFPYAVITALSFCIINLLLSRKKNTHTFLTELFKSFLTLLIISELSYLYNSLFLSKVSMTFQNSLYMFLYTIALGLPISIIYILAKYIYLNKKNSLLLTTNLFNILPYSEENNLDKRKEQISSLKIFSDYLDNYLELDHNDFIFAEAADNYCIIFFDENGMQKSRIIRTSLTKLLLSIQSSSIKKIHRSYVVNLKKVAKYTGNSSGYKISLFNIEKELSISRNYVDTVVPFLKNITYSP